MEHEKRTEQLLLLAIAMALSECKKPEEEKVYIFSKPDYPEHKLPSECKKPEEEKVYIFSKPDYPEHKLPISPPRSRFLPGNPKPWDRKSKRK